MRAGWGLASPTRAAANLLAATVLLVSMATPLAAFANAPQAFDDAMKAMLAGDLEAAERGFAAVGVGPDEMWADDGLREAGRVAELRGRYAEAQAFYRALIARFPDSAYVRHANARLGYLARIVGDDAAFSEAQAAREALMQGASRLEDPAPALIALEALLRREPQLPAWPDAARWLGEQWLQQGDVERGLGWYRALAARPGDDAGARRRALAAALLQVGRLAEATTVIASLEVGGDVTARAAVAQLRRKLISARRQAWWRRLAQAWVFGFAAVVLGFVLASGHRHVATRPAHVGRDLAARLAPDLVVAYALPVGAALVAMSYDRQPMVAAATQWIAIGALGFTWLLGCALRRKPGGGVALALIAGTVIAALALVYVAVTQDRLIDMLIETWRYGHDPS